MESVESVESVEHVEGTESMAKNGVVIRCTISALGDLKRVMHDVDITDYPEGFRNVESELCRSYLTLVEYTVTVHGQIPEGYFKGCMFLTKVVLSKEMVEVPPEAFAGCQRLVMVLWPAHGRVTSIGREAFLACISLREVRLPPTVTELGVGAFRGCGALVEFVFSPSGITVLPKHIFSECRSLTTMYLPQSIGTIKAHAFDKCTHLIHVDIPSSVTHIGRFAFRACQSLASVALPAEVTIEDTSVFPDLCVLYICTETMQRNIHALHNQKIETLSPDRATSPLSNVTNAFVCKICLQEYPLPGVMFTKCRHVSTCLRCCLQGGYLDEENLDITCPFCRMVHDAEDVMPMIYS